MILDRKYWLGMLAVAGMVSCTPWPLESASAPSPSVSFDAPVSSGALDYGGGEVTLLARFENVSGDTSQLTWSTGHAVVLGKGFTVGAQGELETAWIRLRWDTASSKDTVILRRNADVLGTVAVQMLDILPGLSRIYVGSTSDSASMRAVQVSNDTLSLSSHMGAVAYLRLSFRDPDTNYVARLTTALPLSLPGGGTLRWRNGIGDSVLAWQAPNVLYDSTIDLVESDGLGRGTHTWKLHLSTYAEEGSVWVVQHQGTSLVKFATTGGGRLLEILRLDGLGEVTGISIDPMREGGLLVATDRSGQKVVKYTTGGLVRTSVSKLLPRSVACDYDGAYCWAGVRDTAGHSRLVRVDGDTASLPVFPGDITSLAVDQNAYGRVWAASRDSGFVARISYKHLDTLIRGTFPRPSSLAFDDSLSLLWVADLEHRTVSAVDSQGNVVKVLSGFVQPVSVSAFRGRVWVADNLSGEFTRWSASGVCQARFSGYLTPQAVAIDPRNPDVAWGVDMGSGQLLRFQGDSLVAKGHGAGLDRPSLLAVHPGNQ